MKAAFRRGKGKRGRRITSSLRPVSLATQPPPSHRTGTASPRPQRALSPRQRPHPARGKRVTRRGPALPRGVVRESGRGRGARGHRGRSGNTRCCPQRTAGILQHPPPGVPQQMEPRVPQESRNSGLSRSTAVARPPCSGAEGLSTRRRGQGALTSVLCPARRQQSRRRGRRRKRC